MPRYTPHRPIFNKRILHGTIRTGSQVGEVLVVEMVLVGEVSDATELSDVSYLDVSGDIVIATSLDENRATSIDISDRENPVIRDSLQDNTNLQSAQGVAIIGTNAFIAVPGGGGGGAECLLTTVSFSDPDNLSVLGSEQDLTAYSNALYVRRFDATHVVVAGNEVTLTDVSTPASPNVVRSYDVASDFQMGLAVYQEQYALVTGGVEEMFRVIDMTTSPNPTKVGATDGSLLDPRYIAVIGDYAFVADDAPGSQVCVFDLTDPSTPTEVEVYGGVSDGPTWIGAYGEYIIFGDRFATVTFAVDAHAPTALTAYAQVDLLTTLDDIAVVSNLAVLANSFDDKVMLVEMRNFAP